MTTTYNLPADYSTWAALFAVLDDAPLADVTVVKVASGEFNGGDADIPAGVIPSSTNTLTITCADGAQFSDNPLRYGSGARVLFDGASEGFNWAGSTYITLKNLAIKCSGSGAIAVYINDNQGDNTTLQNLLVETNQDNTHGFHVRTTTGTVCENIIVIRTANGNDGYDRGIVSVGNSIAWKNCASIALNAPGGTGAAWAHSSSPTFVNCIAYGYANDWASAANGTNCATDKASGSSNAPSTNAQYNLASSDFVDTTNGTHDLRVASGSTKLKDLGSGTGTTTDIVGNAASGTRDIGPHEYQAAASGLNPWIISHIGLDPGLRMGYLS